MFHSMGIGWLFWLIVLVFVFYIIIKFIKQDKNKITYSENKESAALDILKRRYARGEISEEEFETIKKSIV